MRVGTTRKRQAGMTLIETMIAMAVLMVGMTGVMGLFLVAIQANARSKLDTGGAQVAQMLIEELSSHSEFSSTTFTITDCASPANTWTIATAAGGAQVDSNGNVNWGSTDTYSSLLANNYAMRYVTCAGNTTATYETRWNVTTTGFGREYISVSARPLADSTSVAGSGMFALPSQLRTIVPY